MNADQLQMISFFVAMLCLWGGTVVGVGYLFSPERFRPRYANATVGVGFVLLTLFFLLRWRSVGFLPISNMFESLSFFVWAMVLVYLITEYCMTLPSLSSFMLPIITVFSLVATLNASGPNMIDERLRSAWFYFHVIFAFIGYATFTIAFATAVMYLIQRRQLKAKKSFDSIFHKLPSLETLDELNQKLINMGFPLFTIAIGAGVYWAHRSKILGPNWPNDPKIVATGITWLLYAALFHIRLFSVTRGKRVAQLTIVAFLFIVLTFLGTKYLSVGPHEFLK